MVATIKLIGVEQAIANLAELPRKVAFKHLRIALSAAGGEIKTGIVAAAPRDSGLLAKSQAVKVKIPDQSWDIKHHGRPAYVVIGTKRRAGRFLVRGTLRGFGTAQRALAAERKRLQERVKTLSARKRERAAVANTRLAFPGAVYRNPSRYAHLAERRHRFMASVAASRAEAASKRCAEKLAKAFEIEANLLPKTDRARLRIFGFTLAG